MARRRETWWDPRPLPRLMRRSSRPTATNWCSHRLSQRQRLVDHGSGGRETTTDPEHHRLRHTRLDTLMCPNGATTSLDAAGLPEMLAGFAENFTARAGAGGQGDTYQRDG